MKMGSIITMAVRESLNGNIYAYHGTRTALPFEKFDIRMIGSGLVSGGTKYDGFFFTTEKENAEFYTEYFICKVVIDNVLPKPTENSHPSNVLSLALKSGENYIINDVLDGAIFSDIIVVPKNNLDTIDIIEWEFIGDEEFIFKRWDEFFGDEEGVVNSDMISDTLEMINIDINFLMEIPIFKEYYEKNR